MALIYWIDGEPIGGLDNNGGLVYWIDGEPNGILASFTQTVTLPSLASPSTFGSHTVTPGTATVTLPSLASPAAFGALSTIPNSTIGLSSLASPAAFGSHTLTPGSVDVVLPSLASPAAFGSHTVTSTSTVTLPSLASPARFGTIAAANLVTLPSLDSPATFGSHTLTPGAVTVTLPSLASPAAFGAFTVVGPSYITLPSIGTNQRFGTAIVAGPVTLPSLASPATFGTMLVTQPQEVTLPSLASPAAFGTARVTLVQSVILPSLASPATFGVHTIAGPARYLRLPSITSARFGNLTVEGGVQKIRIFIAGVDRTSWLVPKSTGFQSQQLGRWSANFDFYVADGSWRPHLGQTVMIQDYGRRHFVGFITDDEADRIPRTLTKVFWRCGAIDLNGILDRRWVSKSYDETQDAADIMRDIVVNFLDGEGLTANNIPATLGAIGTKLDFNYDSATAAFDRIRDITGCPWFVDQFSDIHCVAIEELETCPFEINQSSHNWRDLKVKDTLQGFATEIAVRTNRNLLVGGLNGPHEEETFVLPFQYAIDRGMVPNSLVLIYAFSQILSFTVNGIEKEFKDGNTNFFNLDPYWWGFASGPYITPPKTGPDVPSPGDIVVVKYIRENSAIFVNGGAGGRFAPSAPEGDPDLDDSLTGTVGSGRFQSVIQVNDLERQSDLEAIAEAALTRKSAIPILIEFETDDPRGEVGQLIPVNLPDLSIHNRLLMITSVSARSMAVDTGQGSTLRSTIRAVAGGQDLGNYIKWFERFFRRTDHPLPILQYETAEFILAPDGSLSAGVVGTNPCIVKRGGKLVEAMVAFTNASVDEDVVLDVQADGVTNLLGVNKLVCPAGSTILHVTTEFYLPAAYVFEKQILRPVVSYRVTGSSPVAPSNGTLILRWSI